MNLDLGEKRSYPEPCCISGSEDKDKVYYPSLYISGKEELKDLPASGTMTVKFRTVEKTVSKRGGKADCRVELEILEITDAKGGDVTPSKSRDKEFDEIAKEILEESDSD